MTRVSNLLAALVLSLAGLALSTPASAALYGFTVTPFSEGASLNAQFVGDDLNGDGVINGYYPGDCGCDPNEVTSLTLSFTGNSLIPAFSGATIDFASPLQTLVFDELSGGFELIYVVNNAGAGIDDFSLPPGIANGDGGIQIDGVIGSVPFAAFGTVCGGALAEDSFGGGVCGIILYGSDQSFMSDVAMVVPEPAGALIFGAGLAALGVLRRRRARG